MLVLRGLLVAGFGDVMVDLMFCCLSYECVWTLARTKIGRVIVSHYFTTGVATRLSA